MSHIGSKDIKLPNNVVVDVSNKEVRIKGELGTLMMSYTCMEIKLVSEENSKYIRIIPIEDLNSRKISNKSYSLWGTYRTLLDNMIMGVSQGYSKTLELVGVGYKANLSKKDTLVLKVGNSIDLFYMIPQDVVVECPKPNMIVVTGIDKQRVNQVASEIRSYRLPESYKGKGIRYLGEIIHTKEGKKK